jgi:hypothetical protein
MSSHELRVVGGLLRSTASVVFALQPQVEEGYSYTRRNPGDDQRKVLDVLNRLSLLFVAGEKADVVAISAEISADVLTAHLAIDEPITQTEFAQAGSTPDMHAHDVQSPESTPAPNGRIGFHVAHNAEYKESLSTGRMCVGVY